MGHSQAEPIPVLVLRVHLCSLLRAEPGSFLTSITAGETDRVAPACVGGLLGARATEAAERPEHLQTQSSEPPPTNQFSSPFKDPKADAGR